MIQVFKITRWVIATIIVLGLFLHFFVKDSMYPLSAIFYALPIRVIVMMGVAYAAMSIRDKFHRWPSVAVLLLLLAHSSTLSTGFVGENDSPAIAFWNVANGKMDLKEFAGYVNETNSDMYAFVEFSNGLREAVREGRMDQLLEGYKSLNMPGGMAVVCRGDLRVEHLGFEMTDQYRFNKVRIGEYRISVVDILPNPLSDRRKAVEKLLRFSEGCDFICGDFNTPYESVHLDSIRERYNSGMTEVLSRRETWPSYLPLLSLDHIFIRKPLVMVGYGIVDSWVTDHFPVLASVERDRGESAQ